MKARCTCCQSRLRARWRPAWNRCRPVCHSRCQPGRHPARCFAPAVLATAQSRIRVADPTAIPVSSCGSSPDGCRSQASCIQPSRPSDTDSRARSRSSRPEHTDMAASSCACRRCGSAATRDPPRCNAAWSISAEVVGQAGQAEHLAQGAEPRLAIISHAIALVRPSRDVRYSRENGNLCVKLAASPRTYWGLSYLFSSKFIPRPTPAG